MFFSILCLLLFISFINGGRPSPLNILFSLSTDYQESIYEYVHKNCSALSLSGVFLCSHQYVYHIQFYLIVSLARFQYDSNLCGFVLKFDPLISFSKQDSPIEFQKRSVIAVHKQHWNKSSTIFIFNRRQRENFCSLQLPSIGSNCDYRSSIRLSNLSCHIHLTITKTDQLHPLNRTMRRVLSKPHLYGLPSIFIGFTVIPLICLIGNRLYLDQMQMNMPRYLQLYQRGSDASPE